MTKVKVVDMVIRERRLFPCKYSVLMVPSSGQYVGSDGELTHMIATAEEFWGWWWKRWSAAETFATQHNFEVI